MYVPFFGCKSFPYISRRADWFPCALFPFHSPGTPPCCHFCPLHVLSVPLCFPFISRCFPVMSTSYSSPHFLALPCISPLLPNISRKKTHFPAFLQLGRPKPQSFPDFRQKETGTPNQQRAGRGNRAWDPCFATPAPRRLRLVERHQIAARSVPHPHPPNVSDVGRGGVRGVILYPLLGVRHANQCRRTLAGSPCIMNLNQYQESSNCVALGPPSSLRPLSSGANLDIEPCNLVPV